MSRQITLDDLSQEERLHFRDQLREARATALRDAEAFQQIVFVIERFGRHTTSRDNLNGYQKRIVDFASQHSDLASKIPKRAGEWHTSFEVLYDLVKDGRNEALHVGACARHLTKSAVELAIVLEDALMSEATKVKDFMVRNPVTASMWQTLSSIRQTMLSSSFSYLPVLDSQNGETPVWKLVSDYEVVHFLREAAGKRNARLRMKLKDAVKNESFKLTEADTCCPDDLASERAGSEPSPVLVLRKDSNELCGILTPFDLL